MVEETLIWQRGCRATGVHGTLHGARHCKFCMGLCRWQTGACPALLWVFQFLPCQFHCHRQASNCMVRTVPWKVGIPKKVCPNFVYKKKCCCLDFPQLRSRICTRLPMAKSNNVLFWCGLSVPPLWIPLTHACKRVCGEAGSVEIGTHKEDVR